MQREDEIVRVHRGRSRTIRLDVLAWRKLMRRWKVMRVKILELIAASGATPEEVKEWFNTPHPSLRKRPPKALFHPRGDLRALLPLVRNRFDRCVSDV